MGTIGNRLYGTISVGSSVGNVYSLTSAYGYHLNNVAGTTISKGIYVQNAGDINSVSIWGLHLQNIGLTSSSSTATYGIQIDSIGNTTGTSAYGVAISSMNDVTCVGYRATSVLGTADSRGIHMSTIGHASSLYSYGVSLSNVGGDSTNLGNESVGVNCSVVGSIGYSLVACGFRAVGIYSDKTAHGIEVTNIQSDSTARGFHGSGIGSRITEYAYGISIQQIGSAVGTTSSAIAYGSYLDSIGMADTTLAVGSRVSAIYSDQTAYGFEVYDLQSKKAQAIRISAIGYADSTEIVGIRGLEIGTTSTDTYLAYGMFVGNIGNLGDGLMSSGLYFDYIRNLTDSYGIAFNSISALDDAYGFYANSIGYDSSSYAIGIRINEVSTGTAPTRWAFGSWIIEVGNDDATSSVGYAINVVRGASATGMSINTVLGGSYSYGIDITAVGDGDTDTTSAGIDIYSVTSGNDAYGLYIGEVTGGTASNDVIHGLHIGNINGGYTEYKRFAIHANPSGGDKGLTCLYIPTISSGGVASLASGTLYLLDTDETAYIRVKA